MGKPVTSAPRIGLDIEGYHKTALSDAMYKKYRRLLSFRQREDLSDKVKKSKYLRESFEDLEGNQIPLQLRYYQVQGLLHLASMPRFLLGDDTGLGKCGAKNTLISTNYGLIPLGEIEDWSDMEPDSFKPLSQPLQVLINGKSHPIKSFYYGGVKPTITVRTRSGYEITGTHVHPLMVCRGGSHQWVQTRDLRVGDYLCIHRSDSPFPENEPELDRTSWPEGPARMSPLLARFLGYYIGEGSLTVQSRVEITQSLEVNPEIVSDIRSLFRSVFGEDCSRPSSSSDQHYLSRTHIRRFLADNGLEYCLSKDREIPSCIMRSAEDSAREFLRGLLEGEGHAGPTYFEFSSASEKLARQLQILLLRFGVISVRSEKRISGRDHIYWRVNVSGSSLDLFRKRIGLVSSRKREALDRCLDERDRRNTNVDLLPMPELVERARADLSRAVSRSGSNGARRGSGLKQFGAWLVCGFNNIRNCGRLPSYDWARRLERVMSEHCPGSLALQELREVLDLWYFYDPIVSLEHGEQRVFDIEVDSPEHSFVGNGFINHNTIQAISALCFLWDKKPDNKVMVITTKSAAPQWVDEFDKFTVGVKTFLCKGSPKKRESIFREWLDSEGPSVLVLGYATVRQDITRLGKECPKGLWLITDEASAYKTPSTAVHQCVRLLSESAEKHWALTATLIENHLLEGWAIYKALIPGFLAGKAWFTETFCITQNQRVGSKWIEKIVGYRPGAPEDFKRLIEPFFLGRPKMLVAKELPPLTRRRLYVDMSTEQSAKYDEALAGLLGIIDAEGEAKEVETTKLTSLIYCQQIVNSTELLGIEGRSKKLDALIDLLTEGDLSDEKVIVYTRFRKMVDIIERELTKKKIPCTRITGAENEDQRSLNKKAFQDPKNPTRVIVINSAARQGVNLQAAKALIFFDTPWSAGDYLQILGRMIRIGSTHDAVFAYHLITRDTIDEKVQQVLGKKMKLVERVLGRRIKGEDDEIEVAEGNEIGMLFDLLQQDARSRT